MLTDCDPGRDCPACERLVQYRHELRANEPDWFNAPVPTFGDLTSAKLLVVGLAPGVKGANRTGRPFTGDYAGDLLYSSLIGNGFASGSFAARVDDGLVLVDTAITNAVRCVPPQNKPIGAEIAACRAYLERTIEAMPRLRAILTLGQIAHDSTVRTLGLRRAQYRFGHGARYQLPSGVALFSSYHPSRYNVNTGVLTAEMFNTVIGTIAAALET